MCREDAFSFCVYNEPNASLDRFVLAQGSVQTRIWRMYIIELLSEMMYREPGVTFTKCIFSHTLPHTKEKENGGMRQ